MGRLLVSSLSPRRNGPRLAGGDQERAVPNGEHVWIPRRLQAWRHHELIAPARLQTVEILQQIRRFHARCPDHELGGNEVTVRQADPVRPDFNHASLGAHVNPKPFQEPRRPRADSGRNRRQDPLSGFDQRDLEILLRIDAVEPVSDHLPCRAVKLSREFGARGSSPDDGDMQLSRPHRASLCVRPEEAVHKPLVEPDRFVRRIEREGERLGSGRAEVVAGAADRHHEGIVGNGAGRRDLLAFRIVTCGEMNLAVRPVEADHLADAVAEVVVASLRYVVDRIATHVHRAGRHFVQMRLPDVGPGAFDQGDFGLLVPAERVAQRGREFEPRGPTSDNDDVMERGLGDPHPIRSVHVGGACGCRGVGERVQFGLHEVHFFGLHPLHRGKLVRVGHERRGRAAAPAD